MEKHQTNTGEIATFYDMLGKETLSAWEQEYRTADDLQTACHMVGKQDKVLDLACGYGRVALSLAQLGCSLVHGLDISPALISAAKGDAKGLTNLFYTVGDMRKLPYDSQFFDKVFCFWASFAHLVSRADQRQCLSEIQRVLKPGGYCFIVLMDPDHPFWQELLKKTVDRVVVPEYIAAHPPVYIHNEQTFEETVAGTGFTKVEFERRTMNHSSRLVVHLYN